MAVPFFSAPTLDDVMRLVVEAIWDRGERIKPTKGDATELTGVLLEVSNPRARISRTETRGRPFSSLGELCWYLAKNNSLDFISYYIPAYGESAENGIVHGGYGPRLFDWHGIDQMANVVTLLKKRRDSRQAVIQLFDASDISTEHKDVPCTCTLQFLIRRDTLNLLTSMRSNDVFLGLPHDVFCFTMIQEIVARTLGVEIGTYKHSVGSLHLYDRNRDAAKIFLQEGWQSTTAAMPPMPTGDPAAAISQLLEAESQIRREGGCSASTVDGLDPYWADLVRLLQMLRFMKSNDFAMVQALRGQMSSRVYDALIESRCNSLVA